MDKLGVFNANQTSMCLDPHLNWGWRSLWNWLKLSNKSILPIILITIVCDVMSPSHVVSWVRCGPWMYRFLIVDSFLTLNAFHWCLIVSLRLASKTHEHIYAADVKANLIFRTEYGQDKSWYFMNQLYLSFSGISINCFSDNWYLICFK